MSVVRTRITSRTIEAAMKTQKTRSALSSKADRVASRARSIATSEGEDMTVERSGGTRPKGRSYERVSSPDVAQEFGTWRVTRKRILGRAAESA